MPREDGVGHLGERAVESRPVLEYSRWRADKIVSKHPNGNRRVMDLQARGGDPRWNRFLRIER